MGQWYRSFAALPFVIACADDPVRGPEPRATIAVQRDTVSGALQTAPSGTAFDVEWLRFSVPIAIHNVDRRSIEYVRCTYTVEEPTESGWRTIWSPICTMEFAPPLVIQPGETLRLVLPVTAVLKGQASPRWESNKINGTYRVTVYLRPSGQTGVVPLTGSNTFVLVAR